MTTTFDYKVRDQTGNLIQGQLEGDSLPAVVGRLRDMGYLPVSVTAAPSAGLRAEIVIPGFSDRIKPKEVAVFTRQFATMVDSGLSISRSLAVLANQVENKFLAQKLKEIREDIEAGSSLSQALAKHPKVFSNLYVAMVQAGEVGGSIDIVLRNTADQLEAQVELNRKVRGAMVYPIVVLSVIAIIFLVMMVVIVPIFKKLFTTLGGQLPLPTRILITISNTLISWRCGLVVAVIIAGIFTLRWWINTEDGRLKWDAFKMKPPVFGELTHKAVLARFASTLSSLLQSGVPVMEALDIVSSASDNRVMEEAVADIKTAVREGRSFADPMRQHEIFTPLMVQMTEVGEQTGALDEMLQRSADFYMGEVNQTVDNLTSILEPLLVVTMGAIVGTIIISLYLPMFSYIKLVH
jgi:type IV pilus assembly protein PilC